LFDELCREGSVVRYFDKVLANKFRANFEEGMDILFATAQPVATMVLRDMAKYFVRFYPGKANGYKGLATIVSRIHPRPVIVTTNYDLLIERALSRVGLLVSYGSTLPGEEKLVPVLKIHGSCNFLPNLGQHTISGINFILPSSSSAPVLDAPVSIATLDREVIQFCNEQDSIAPCMALFSPSKKVLYSSAFTNRIKSEWIASLRAADIVFVIGLRVHEVDSHIWAPLASATASIRYVGPQFDEFLSWSQRHGRSKDTVICKEFLDSISRISSFLIKH